MRLGLKELNWKKITYLSYHVGTPFAYRAIRGKNVVKKTLARFDQLHFHNMFKHMVISKEAVRTRLHCSRARNPIPLP
jgi:hypothetical protein